MQAQSGINIAFVFADELMLWTEHYFPKICGRLLKLIFGTI